jgi:hypothetical protein
MYLSDLTINQLAEDMVAFITIANSWRCTFITKGKVIAFTKDPNTIMLTSKPASHHCTSARAALCVQHVGLLKARAFSRKASQWQ